jgi:DNA modification methylase
MDGYQADLVVTDPPYNIDYTGKTKKALKIQNDSKTDEDFFAFILAAYGCTFTAMKDGAGSGLKLSSCCV